MSQLTADQLPDDERADVAKAKALIDPYVQIASVEWLAPTKEAPCATP